MPPAVNKNLAALLLNHAAKANRKPIVALEGSSRSGKTWAILEYLIVCCLDAPGLVVTCFRHDGTTHEKSTIRDFKLVLALKFPATAKKIRANWQAKSVSFPNGSVFEFAATNDITKLHGPQRDVSWFNEVMEISYEAWVQIQNRTAILTICDWNPSLAHHWVFDRVLTGADVCYVHSTFADNPHLTGQQRAAIEKLNPEVPENVATGTADKWAWEVYGLGKRGRREGVIYEKWEIVDEFPEPMYCQRWGHGVDFGFSQDPTAVVECAVFQGDLWLRERVYRMGLVIRKSESLPGQPSLEAEMEAAGCSKSARYYCDGARPESIRDLQLCGYSYVMPGDKGPGSILAGIGKLRGWRMRVHRSSQNLQRELEQYSWKKNRATGVWTDEPEDANNHLLDALRYWASRELHGGVYTGGNPKPQQEADTCLVRH
jgi:phage terminase large subunit